MKRIVVSHDTCVIICTIWHGLTDYLFECQRVTTNGNVITEREGQRATESEAIEAALTYAGEIIERESH